MASSGAGGEPSRSAIVSDTTSGHHLLTIHGYTRTKVTPTGKCVMSRPFTVGGHRWRIDYYPNGIRTEVADCVSLCLMLDEDVAAGVKAQYDMCLAGGEEEALQAASMASRSVDHFPSWGGWEYATFISRKDLESCEHLRGDSFTIRCDIVVVHDCHAVDDAAAFVSVPPCDLRQNLGRLLETEMGADVVFKVGSVTLPAHRCVLAACSPVFAAELFGPMKEGNAAGAVVRVEDMEVDVFKALLCFAYTGSLPETPKEDEEVTWQHLLVAADKYNIGRLKMICEQ
ncbi:hypothetical protein ACQJBY_056248 [Aegilops geniculata]